MYLITQRDGVNLTFVDGDFAVPYRGPFDTIYYYMRSVFACAQSLITDITKSRRLSLAESSPGYEQ